MPEIDPCNSCSNISNTLIKYSLRSLLEIHPNVFMTHPNTIEIQIHKVASKSYFLLTGGKSGHHYCCHEYNNAADSSSFKSPNSQSNNPQYSQDSQHPSGVAEHCCNFQHIVQLQDGTTRSVLCSNLKLAPIRLRNQFSTCHQIGNGSCVNINSTTTATTMCHNNSEQCNSKVYSGPERII